MTSGRIRRGRLVSVVWSLGLAASVATASAADEVKTRTITVQDITLTVPETWKDMPAANKLRLAQFEIPAVKGDDEPGELVVSSFPGGGGGIDANITRWVNQFQAVERTAKVTKGQSKQGTYYLVDIAGTYNKPDGPPFLQKTKPQPGARMIGAILVVEGKAVYFLKLPGPQKTIAAALAAFRASFGGDAATEKAYEIGAGN